MPEEVLRYRIEIDEASLQSELARTRGSITSVLTEAISTGQYALNNVMNDMALARQSLVGPPQPPMASPTGELGFFGSAFALTGLGPPPPNMLMSDFRERAGMEMQSRIAEMTAAISRQAVPVGMGVMGAIGARAVGYGPLGMLAGGGLGFLGGRAITGGPFEELEARGTAEEILSITRAPTPMAPFTPRQRNELARGLAMDVAADVRFGIEDLNTLLAGGMGMDLFAGTRTVEDFRTRFRQMLDQVRTITRVFQQTTEEAVQTLGQLNRFGLGAPEAISGRIADILSLRRGGMDPQQALDLGMTGAQMASERGMPAGVGIDMMLQNVMMGQAMGRVMPAGMFGQMGGAAGIGSLGARAQFGVAGLPGMRTLLAAFANDSMENLDQSMVREFVSGNIDIGDIRQRAWDRLSDPAQRTRFSANIDLLQNALATSNMALPVQYRMAEMRAGAIGARPEDVFGMMMGEMGLDPMQRRVALEFARNPEIYQQASARAREMAQFEIDMNRYQEESRFTSRVGALWEQMRGGVATAVGEPIQGVGAFVGRAFESIVSFPARALQWMDVGLGRAIFGGPQRPIAPMMAGMYTGPQTVADLQRQSEFISGMRLSDVGSRLSGKDTLKNVSMVSKQEATKNLRQAVASLAMYIEPITDMPVFAALSSEERENIEQDLIANFANDLHGVTQEADQSRRKEKKAQLREKMEGWFRTNLGHLSQDDVKDAKTFADGMLKLEEKSDYEGAVALNLEKAAKATAVLQMRQYVGEELPALLAQGARTQEAGEALIGISTTIAKQFKGRPQMAAYEALRTLGARALPHLAEGGAIAERIGVAQKLIGQGFLTPADMIVTTKELESIRAQDLSATQKRFVDDLLKASSESEGHQLNADTIFRSIGVGLGRQYPSETPSPGAGMDPYKWDMTATTLDRLAGAVNNLSKASKELLGQVKDERKKTAGVA